MNPNQEQVFYVYIYLRKDGSPYYVGKGSNGRWRAKNHNVIIPPPERVIFSITQTTEEWAHFIEMELIDKLGRLNDGTGILENKTDGGEGVVDLSGAVARKISIARKGQKHTLEVRMKMSSDRMGSNNNFYGKYHTEETKKKMSGKHMNKVLSESHRKNISKVVRDRIWAHNNVVEKRFYKDQIELDWIIGRLPGQKRVRRKLNSII